MADKKEPARKHTTDPHPLFGGNPAQYADDVAHRPEDDSDQEVWDYLDGVPGKTPAAMAQKGRWTR